VVDKIGSLLQAHLDKSQSKVRRTMHAIHLSTQRVSEQETPEARENLNAVLDKIIEAIKTNVDLQIKADHANTQQEIDTSVQTVVDSHNNAATKYDTSKNADAAWMDCMAIEKTKLQESETAGNTSFSSLSNEEELCQVEIDTAPFSAVTPEEDFAYVCERETEEDENGNDECAREPDDFKRRVDEYVEELEASVAAAKILYANAKSACDTATEESSQANILANDAISAWSTQRDECVELNGTRKDAICLFGTKFQIKCTNLASYESLMDEIDQSNSGQNSHPDRVEQWTASHVTQCMLSKVKEDFEINSVTLQECNSTVDFEAHVGQLDRKATEIAGASSPHFSCTDTKIYFHGTTWIVSSSGEDGEVIQSEDYFKETWEPDSPPPGETESFSFC